MVGPRNNISYIMARINAGRNPLGNLLTQLIARGLTSLIAHPAHIYQNRNVVG